MKIRLGKNLPSGLYFKPITIVNDDSRVINKLEASLTGDARVIIYETTPEESDESESDEEVSHHSLASHGSYEDLVRLCLPPPSFLSHQGPIYSRDSF
jgi:hypothetical protein